LLPAAVQNQENLVIPEWFYLEANLIVFSQELSSFKRHKTLNTG
jgi:hypothetical protein